METHSPAETPWMPDVLIVDNDDEMRDQIWQDLVSWNYRPVLAAGQGPALLADTLALLARSHYAVALIDLRIGDNYDPHDQGGLDVIRAIRARSGTNCILRTAFPTVDVAREAIARRGAFDLAHKNAPPAELRGLLARAVRYSCLCEQSGTLHWHPAAGDMAGRAASAPPADTRSLLGLLNQPPGGAALDGTRILAALDAVLDLLEHYQARGEEDAAPPFEPLIELYLLDLLDGAAPMPVRFAAEPAAALELPDPVAWLAARRLHDAPRGQVLARCHRALRLADILIDAAGQPWIDQMWQAGCQHHLYDLAALLVDLLAVAELGQRRELPLIYQLVSALIEPDSLAQAPRPPQPVLRNPRARQLFHLAQQLARRALGPELGDGPGARDGVALARELRWAVLLEAVRRLLHPLETQLLQPAARARLQLVAALCCARLDKAGGAAWPPPGWPEIDVGETWSYREDELRHICRAIGLGESLIVAGRPSMHRAPALQHIGMQPHVQQHYLGRRAADTIIVYADCNDMLELDDRHFYELLLTRLSYHPAAQAHHADLLALRHEAILSNNGLLALRNLEHAVDLVLADQRLALSFILSSFDEPYARLAPRVFRALRALYEYYPSRLGFVLGLNAPPARQSASDERAAFTAMFLRTYWLAPDNQADAELVLRRVEQRLEWQLPEPERAAAIALSGCHPVLLNAICLARYDQPQLDLSSPEIGWALELPAVQTEFGQLWHALDARERLALIALVLPAASNGHGRADNGIEPSDPAAVRRLRDRALLVEGRVFSPLFARFVEQKASLLMFDGSRFWLRGAPLALSNIPLKIVKYLYSQAGKLCSNEELQSLWREDPSETEPHQKLALEQKAASLHQHIRAIHNALGDKTPFRYLVNDRAGGGYRLLHTDHADM